MVDIYGAIICLWKLILEIAEHIRVYAKWGTPGK